MRFRGDEYWNRLEREVHFVRLQATVENSGSLSEQPGKLLRTLLDEALRNAVLDCKYER